MKDGAIALLNDPAYSPNLTVDARKILFWGPGRPPQVYLLL